MCIRYTIRQIFILFVLIVIFSGRHASKVTEEEEDEEYLKEEESGAGNTRLVVQPSCKFFASPFSFR